MTLHLTKLAFQLYKKTFSWSIDRIMKKEFYKLSFVFIMIVFSFSLAFFLGREMTLSSAKKKPSKRIQPDMLPNQQMSSPEWPPSNTKQSQREKVNLYKKTLSDKVSQKSAPVRKPEPVNKLSATNKKSPDKTPADDTKTTDTTQTKQTTTLHTLLIAQYEHKKSAIEKSTQLKIRFPHWKIFFKKFKNSYKVYIGTFKSKEAAEKFLKELEEDPNFSNVKLEKL